MFKDRFFVGSWSEDVRLDAAVYERLKSSIFFFFWFCLDKGRWVSLKTVMNYVTYPLFDWFAHLNCPLTFFVK